ncbi:dynein heavy chain domain-containing protein 1 [Bufo gargarizans]|uniref:dynein heavy chain domain-containing protein 1 n=1 Tax=Bufo gargarizans TaxID=30331 RepID=UPI001CF55029|nr:dynein heavy chain domain-containing protein 1 [Bufo gargarizans]
MSLPRSFYDLRVSPVSRRHPEHFLFSPFGILYVNPGSGSEVQELGAWHREAVLCRSLRRIPFCRDFLTRRAFRWWRRCVRRTCFLRRSAMLSRRLLTSVPHYTAALHHINRFLQELAQLSWLPAHVCNPITIDQLDAEQILRRSTAKSHLCSLLSLASQILDMVRQDTYMMVQTSQEDAVHCLDKATRGRLAHVESWLHRLGSLSSLVGYIICENLMSILQRDVSGFVSGIMQMMSTTGRPFLLVRLEFGEDGDLRLCPSAGQIQQSVEQMLNCVLDDVLQVMDAGDQEPPQVSSMILPRSEHGSSVLSGLGGQHIRQVVPASALPPGKCREMPMPGGLRIEGHQQRAHYLSLNVHSLRYILHSDGCIQEALRQLQSLLQDSFAEVRTFCEDQAWLCEVHRYVQSWSSHVLETLRGSSSRDYEELILKLQQWEQRVCGLKDCVTTAMLEVSCELIHTRTGCGLGAILHDLLALLTSEVADKSQSLIWELSRALEIFRGVSTEISAFSKCAHQVAEYKVRKCELEEQVEHVRSLREVIRMNYRQQTAEEQKVNNELTETWDMFQHFLKTSSKFLSSHLSSMSSSLEHSFQACYKEAEDLIAASSSDHYRDPDQNVAVILSDLGTLHHKLCSSLSQLRDFSHSRQVLQGKSFDFSTIFVGEKQIQARQDSWKLLSRCREQITAWKLRPFMKVNIEQMREKLQQWENSLQDLMLILLDEDPILQSVRGCLQDFSQHLPLLQSLLDPAVKHKHWAAIFDVMGKTSEEPETLTLMELLSDPILKEQEQIHKTLLQARAEFSVLQDFEKIQTFWQEREFRLVRFLLCVTREDPAPDLFKRPPSGKFRDRTKGYSTQDTGTFLLADTRSLCCVIEDSLLSLQTIRGSPYSACQRDEISRWIQKLTNLDQVLDLWITFQRKWVFLTKIQSEMEIPLPKMEMVTEFQSVDQSYRSFLEVTVLDPLVLSILTPSKRREWHFYGDSLCSALQRGIHIMEDIIVTMDNVMYTFRCDFPRLFFLSDQDVINVLAASPDPSDRLPCALLCFPQFTDVLFQAQPPESSGFPLISSHDTVGIIGKYGDALNLNPPIKWNPRTVSWLIELEQRVQESLKEELTVCLTKGRLSDLHQPPHHSALQWWVQHGMSYHLQCLIVTEEVLWCEEVEKLILTDQSSRLGEHQNLKIEILVQKMRQGAREQRKSTASVHQELAFLSAWISLAILQRDRTLSLLDTRILTLDCFSWAKLMKYRAPTQSGMQEDAGEMQPACHGGEREVSSSPLCFVDMLGHILPYKYEYVGLDMKIMDSAVSERTSLGLILALEHYQCGAFIGQDEGLRTQTLVAFGCALGRQVVVLKCWAGLNVTRLTLHLQGALQGGAWLILDNADRLSEDVLVSLGQLFSDIQSSCEALMKKGEFCGHIDRSTEIIGNVQLEERTLSVMRSYGCFVTLPHMDSSVSLPCNLRLLLRPVSFCPPDLQNIAELTLLSAGFQEHFPLAKKLSFFFQLAEESGAVLTTSVLPLLKNVLQKAIVLLRLDIGAIRSPDQPQSPLLMESGCTTVTTSLQEETKVVTALLASSLWSRHPVSEHVHLMDILRSVFPVSVPPLLYDESVAVLSLQQHLHVSGLEGHAELNNNVMQLYQAIQHTSGVLLTGPSGCGKTTCWKTLQQALNHQDASEAAMNAPTSPSYQSVQSIHIYPNSLSPTELLGGRTDGIGVFSRILHRTIQESAVWKWVILDGSAAPTWVEPISCLFGQQPMLTLTSGQQLHLTDRIKLLFEMSDTSALSPAMSSECSLVYCGSQETWRTVLKASLSSMYMRFGISRRTQHKLRTLSEQLIPRTLCFLEEHCSTVLHPHPAKQRHTAHGVHQVSSFCTILQALMDQHLLRDSSHRAPIQPEHRAEMEEPRDTAPGSEEGKQGILSDNHLRAQTFFLYAFIWAFGGHLDPRHRSVFDGFLRKSLVQCVLQAELPQDASVFDVTPTLDGLTLIANPRAGQPESLLYAARCMVLSGHPVLLVGAPGSEKTTLTQLLVPSGATSTRIPFNSMLQAGYLRQLLTTQHEASPTMELTRVRALRARQLFILDDLHEAWADPESGTQPALEVVRQIVSDTEPGSQYGFLATMSPPEDGCRPLCPRLSRLFCVLVMTPSSSDVLISLFSPRFMNWLKSTPSQQPKEFSEALAAASISLYQQVTTALPAKYCFSLHHLHRLLQSMTFLCPSPGATLPAMPNASISATDLTQCAIVRLWSREALRTFGDGLETHKEIKVFRELLQGCVLRTFSSHHMSENMAAADGAGTIELASKEDGKLMVTDMETDVATPEEVGPELDVSCNQSPSPGKFLLPPELLVGDDYLKDFLHEYSYGSQVRPSKVQTDHNLTLSSDDCHHLGRLTRVLHLPRGHIVLLAKYSGTGRRSLARLAAQLTKCTLLELSGKENPEECHAIIREACWRAGVQGSSAAILAGEETPQRELEAVIREGTFPGLYSAEQEETILQAMVQMNEKNCNKRASKKSLRERYSMQVRNNLHVIFLQKIDARFPQLMKFTYTDVYHPWSFTSLRNIAEKLLSGSPIRGSLTSNISRVMSSIHLLAQNYCHRMWPHLPLTTPGAFISFIQIYLKVSSELQDVIDTEEERLRRAVSRVEQVFDVREYWTKEMEKCSQRLQEAEQEKKHWSKELEEIREEEGRVKAECEALERTKERVRATLTRLQSQRQNDLQQARLQWAAVQKELKILDVEEIRSYRAPPPPVIMVTDVLCTVFGKESGWENAKLLIGQDNFYQDLQFYDGHRMADGVFAALTRAVNSAEFNVRLVRLVSAAAASLCQWLVGLQRYCSILRTLEKGRAILSEVEAEDLQAATRIADQKLLQEKLMMLKAQSSHNLQKAQDTEKDLQEDLQQLRSKRAAAQECESRAQPHLNTWSSALETLQRRRQSLQVDSLLVSASVTYLGCLPWSCCTALLDKLWSLCSGDEVSVDPDDMREVLESPSQDRRVPGHLLELLCSPSKRMMWQKERLPMNMETLTRAALLRASGFYSAPRPTLILDPDLRAERWLQVLLCTQEQKERGKASPSHGDRPWQSPLDEMLELCVIDASDMAFTQRLSSAREQGLCVLIRNVEKMPSCLETVLQCRQGSQCHPVPSSKRREAPSSSNDGSTQNPLHPVVPPVTPDETASVLLPLFLSTRLPLNIFVQEVGASFLKDVTVVDLSLGPSGLEELLVQEMVQFKDPRLQEERQHLSWNALKLMEARGSAQDQLLDYVSSGTSPLFEDKDFLNVVSTCEEAKATLQQSMQDVEILQQQLQAPMTPYVSAAQSCVHLFSRLQEVSRLSPHYHFPVSSILNWALSALHGQTESGQELEKVLTRGVLTRVLPMIAEEHRHVLHVLLAVGRPHPLEWFSFLGLRCKSVFETLSSCIQRPQWVDVQAWEALAQLEKLSAFQGIRSSLSAQPKQWQEYFSLRSTVIGPIPCSSFSHLTLFQAAILWRILKPECLGLVLSHLSSCILGPEPEDKCQEDVISQSDPHTPVLFIRPAVSPDLPTCYILHLAQKSGKEVKMLSWSETLPASTMTGTVLTSQREGHWLLLNWHPKLADLLLTVKDEVNPDFRLCVTVDEEMMSSVPVALGFGSCSAPCALRLTLRDVLLQSCLDVAEDLGLQNTLPLKLLILHSVLLLRQEYSQHVQRRAYCWGLKDLRNAVCAVRTVMAQCQDWSEALPHITGAVIYGGHIVEEDDAQSVMAVVQHCLQESHQRGSRGLSQVMSALPVGGVNGPGLCGVTWSLQKLLSMRDLAVLGLSEGLKNVTTELYGYRLFSDLLITQDVWMFHPCRAILQDCSSGCRDSRRRRTSSESSSPRSPVVHDTSQCLDLLLELVNEQQRTERELDPGLLLDGQQVPGPDTSCTLSSRANTKTTSAEWPKEGTKKPRSVMATDEEADRWSKPRPMLRFLLHEWKLLHTLIQGATQEARDAASSCLCQKCQEMRRMLSEGHVPPGWNVYSLASPVTLQAWIQGLHLRLKLLSTYMSQSSPLNVTYNVSVFRQPSGLLHSLLQEQALEDHRELESYRLQMQVSGRTSPSLQPVGISLVGIHLRHALWDTRLELLQETLSPQLCALPSIHISAVPQASNAKCHHPAQSYYLCPLYSGEGPGGHKQHQERPLLLLPLPTTVSPFLWSQRRVHTISLL